jgi:hypothetical protein
MPRISPQPTRTPHPRQLPHNPQATLLRNLLPPNDIEDKLLPSLARIAPSRVNQPAQLFVKELLLRFLLVEAHLDARVTGQEVADVGATALGETVGIVSLRWRNMRSVWVVCAGDGKDGTYWGCVGYSDGGADVGVA